MALLFLFMTNHDTGKMCSLPVKCDDNTILQNYHGRWVGEEYWIKIINSFQSCISVYLYIVNIMSNMKTREGTKLQYLTGVPWPNSIERFYL